jgi:hypothetical protein
MYLKQFLSLVLVVAIALPSTLFAQSNMSTKVDITTIPGFQTYLNQPKEVLAAKAKRLPSAVPLVLIGYEANGTALLSALGAWFVTFAGYTAYIYNNPIWSIISYSEYEILNDKVKLAEYLHKRFTLEVEHPPGQFSGGKLDVDKRFTGLGKLFAQIEDALNFQWQNIHWDQKDTELGRGYRGSGVYKGGVDEKFLDTFIKAFDRDGNKPSRKEVLDIIRCIAQAKDPKVLLSTTHFSNLVHSLRNFGFETTREMVAGLTSDVFQNDIYGTHIEPAMRANKEKFAKAHPSELILNSVTEPKYKRLVLEKNVFWDDIRTGHEAFKAEGIKMKKIAGGKLAVGSVGAGLLVYFIVAFFTSDQQVSDVLEMHNLNNQEGLASAFEDPELYGILVDQSLTVAAFGAWAYDQVQRASRDQRFLSDVKE